jgi:hypothetical protein
MLGTAICCSTVCEKTSVFLTKTKDFQDFFFSFLRSLFAPLNGIQQLEDTSDTQLDQVLSTCLFVPYGHNFCVTQPCRYGIFG